MFLYCKLISVQSILQTDTLQTIFSLIISCFKIHSHKLKIILYDAVSFRLFIIIHHGITIQDVTCDLDMEQCIEIIENAVSSRT